MDFLGLNLIFLLAPCPNPVRWEGWMSDLVEAFSLHAAASQGRRARSMRRPLAPPLERLGKLQLSSPLVCEQTRLSETPQKPSFQPVENHLSD